jgi:hypothetical protein
MQARLRFVQYQERRRPRREQGGDPQQVAQRAIREFRRTQRPQQGGLPHLQHEPVIVASNPDTRPRKRILHYRSKHAAIPDFLNCRPCRREAGTFVGKGSGVTMSRSER